MADSDQNRSDESKDLKRKAPMASTSGSTPNTELPNLPEPQCLKDLIDSERCSKPFEKEITPADKSQYRLALDKNFVKTKFLPMLTDQEDVNKGVAVTVYGPDGIGYEMSFGYWGSVDMYVLNKGWKEFADKHELKPSEHFVTIWMFMLCYYLEACTKRGKRGCPLQNMSYESVALGLEAWNEVGKLSLVSRGNNQLVILGLAEYAVLFCFGLVLHN